MTARAPIPPAFGRHAAMLLAASSICLAACAGPGRRPDAAPRATAQARNSTAPAAPPTPLEQLAARQWRRIGRGDRDPPQMLPREPPPTLLGELVISPTPESSAPLPDAIERLAAAPLDLDRGAPASPELTEGAAVLARDAAVRLYVAGRVSLANNDAAGAIGSLVGATNLDPTSVEAWLALGTAQGAAGMTTDAARSYRNALALGSEDMQAMLVVAADAQDRGQHDVAATLLARASKRDLAAEDPALPNLVAVSLSQSLAELGWMRAAGESMVGGLALPQRFDQPTRYRAQISSLFRRRAELAVVAADAELAAGRPAAALAAYAVSAEAQNTTHASLTDRRVYAAVLAGVPAEGALAVLEEVRSTPGPFGTRLDSLVRYLARADAQTARLLSRELDAQARAAACESRRRSLLRAAAAGMSPARARGRLITLLTARTDDDRVLAELLGAADASNRVAAARSAIATIPSLSRLVAARLVASADDPEQVERVVRASPRSMARDLLLAELLALSLRREEALKLLTSTRSADDDQRAAFLAARIRVAAAAGFWADALAAVEDLRRLGGPQSEHLARALQALPRPRDAAEALPADPSGERGLLLLRARIARDVGDWADEEAAWAALRDLDPCDERAHLGLIELYSRQAAKFDPDRAQEALEAFAEHAPRSPDFRVLRARHLAATGRIAPAERELVEALRDDPQHTAALSTLVAVWELASASDSTVPDRARAALAHLEKRAPLARSAAVARARVAFMSGDQAGAIETLRPLARGTWLSRDAALALERMLEQTGRAQEARDVAEARLAHTGWSVAAVIERIDRAADAGEPAAAAALVDRSFPEWAQLSDSQAAALREAAESAAQRALDDAAPADDRARLGAIGLIDAARRRLGGLPAGTHSMKLSLLARARRPDINSLIEAAIEGISDDPSLAETGLRPIAAALVAGRNTGPAVAFLRGVSERADPPNAAVAAEWLRWSMVNPPITDTIRAVEAAGELGIAADVLILLAEIEGRDIPESPVAELAYRAGVALAGRDRDDDAERMYELALRLDPKHVWANNNLGYALVERGERLEEAERMLELAYGRMPESANVADSLGWARYKLGVFRDETDGSGAVVREGAVTLLARATAAPDGRDNPVIHDHLGDAAWRADDPDAAKSAWHRAETIGLERLRRPAPDAASRVYTERLELVVMSARGKRLAVERGRPPPVAPTANPP